MGAGCTCEQSSDWQLLTSGCCTPAHLRSRNGFATATQDGKGGSHSSSSKVSQQHPAGKARPSQERWGPQIYKQVICESEAESGDCMRNGAGEKDQEDEASNGRMQQLTAVPPAPEGAGEAPASAENGEGVARKAEEQRRAASNSFRDSLKKAFMDDHSDSPIAKPEETRQPSNPQMDSLASAYLEESRRKAASTEEATKPVQALPQGATFEVTIPKEPGTRLGLEIASRSRMIFIDGIKPEGLVRKWNAEHPDLEVQEGDRIVAVNGRADSSLVEELTREGTIHMVVIKGSHEEYMRYRERRIRRHG